MWWCGPNPCMNRHWLNNKCSGILASKKLKALFHFLLLRLLQSDLAENRFLWIQSARFYVRFSLFCMHYPGQHALITITLWDHWHQINLQTSKRKHKPNTTPLTKQIYYPLMMHNIAMCHLVYETRCHLKQSVKWYMFGDKIGRIFDNIGKVRCRFV